MGADAKPRAGQHSHGKLGASRSAGEGAVDWVQTLLRGRPRQVDDLAFKTRKSAAQELWVVVVDASASTRRHQALSDAKGLLVQLFEDAYRQRVRVAVLQASGNSPQWQVSGAKASKMLGDWLTTLGAGGGTPLLQALEDVAGWLRLRRKQLPQEQQRFLLVTDGRLKAWTTLPVLECPGLLIDIERGPIRLGKSRQMATELAIDYLHIDETVSC
ncbi:vWA domain-containing protein [Pseudomonas saxonica]|uniref:VWA domain-containing protein n=1 Tax=Pseudomonas saxonica TaxID=2600598 RepID=A0A5C5PX47_9PSED|nr:VWA domain-containing protein [Pseudomonas saxonica]TWR88409.1 VWA domain-containing protein [Pseudomonas saxonica]WRQ74805.1 VWA domain-containing protein [Pseudomonas saxonica]